jgi:hypothetical protein
MHVKSILSRWLGDRTVIGHAARLSALVRVVQALLVGGKIVISQLGRYREGDAHVKHHIKAVDRLVGNRHLQQEELGIYRAIAHSVLAGVAHPVLLIDWSDFECGGARQWAMIQAAVPLGGRAVVIFSRVFPFKRYNSPGAHREFLSSLKSILPQGCQPTLVTDAGFRGPWFRAVEAHGWHWVGRIRNTIKYLNPETGRWRFVDSLYKRATAVTQYIGNVLLSRRHSYSLHLYLVRAYAPARGGRRGKDHNNANANLYRRLYRAPWLLATSLPHQRGSERRIKQLYATRMQIEQTLRDSKSHRFGFGLRYARSGNAKRIQILLLIAALASWILWLAGLAGRSLNLARHFQANTVRCRNVLSTPYLGRQLILKRVVQLTKTSLDNAFVQLKELTYATQMR